jgi:flagellar hook assembly protein FlgD
VTYTLRLDPVFPNPFNPTAHVSFVLPEKGLVDVVIYNVAGERVRSLMHETREEGPHLVLWSGNNDTGQQVAAGVYWVRMVYANETLVQKMVLVQ